MKYEVGDRVLVKGFWGYYHAHIKIICRGIFGTYYLATYMESVDGGDSHERMGKIYPYRIICKN
jgi:hypothetical protein